jgi:hypothetical protein
LGKKNNRHVYAQAMQEAKVDVAVPSVCRKEMVMLAVESLKNATLSLQAHRGVVEVKRYADERLMQVRR